MHRLPVVDDDLLGVPAAAEQPHHAVAELEPFGPLAEGNHLSRELQPGHLMFGLRPRLRITAPALHQVGAVQRRGADTDEKILGTWPWVRDLCMVRTSGPPGEGMTIAFMKRQSTERASSAQ